MPPGARGYDFWEDEYGPVQLVVDCLLPTGVIVPLQVNRDKALADIKEELWDAAIHYPLYALLGEKNSYVFMCINNMAEKVELMDETRRLSEVKPFHTMLKLVQREIKKGKGAEKMINSQISSLIGKGLHEFESLKGSEVCDFRGRMRQFCERIAKERDLQPWLNKVMCLYPPELASNCELPPQIAAKLRDGNLMVSVRVVNTNVMYTLRVDVECLPETLVQMALQKKANTSGISLEATNNYVLKVCGREEYLLGHHPLSQHMYLRRMVAKGEVPQLILVEQGDVLGDQPPFVPPRPNGTLPRVPPLPPPSRSQEKSKPRSLWDVDEPFLLTLHDVTNIHSPDFSKHTSGPSKLYVRACIYHGGEPLSRVVHSKEQLAKDSCAKWGETLEFDVRLPNIPRMGRLCFLLYSLVDRRGKQRPPTAGGRRVKEGKQEIIPLAWVNIPVFDYKGILRTGTCRLYMWSITDDDILSEELLNPIGTVECNPHGNAAVCVNVSFHKYNYDGPISYPPFEKVIELAAQAVVAPQTYDSNYMAITVPVDTSDEGIKKTFHSMVFDESKVNKSHLERLRLMIERDPLNELTEQDKELIWMLRLECQFHFPLHSLPNLLSCVQWNNHKDVAQMQALLQIWPLLPPTKALELLDFAYADKAVRSFAVKCLQDLSDSELLQFLLQLVQVLKYESYLECDLVEFLLRRALNNQIIGHYFFWLLRAEMHVPSVSVRFGLILEAYCRGNIQHVGALTKQVLALGKLKATNQLIKEMSKKETPDKVVGSMRKIFQQSTYQEVLSDLNSVLDPCQRLRTLKIDLCKFKSSKMKPLWLVFENNDIPSPDVFIMYKIGDDLRQDMLTLQILRIIDNIWQEEGLDLRLNAYGCLTTGQNEGVIEIMTHSKTIADIQKAYTGKKLKSGFNKLCLYEWLKQHNPDPVKLSKAIQEFTLSCAGYSVATYVLGIADRHSDNIMLKENGQLFHIDFGHFLGHFKSKFGFQRERVPFVLTSDFVYIIQKGPENRMEDFEAFRELCEKAYLALRRRSNFLITLFMMMMNTGIPELSSLKDIYYLKTTLVPHLSEEEAIIHWRSKFQKALKSFWSELNNTIHNFVTSNV